ncbi:pentapeptide repeat-containing protein [Kordiimonas marina]|uniref:pentapeptide repeat-containing protein n=1 Tax=Kordiimonas marina TaxID=2872312 RepID=UPI001FF528C5|nr:pentapeptide repeat-containing protein [Kordiimonas marina]MCJ9428602.1 pentapeptide repeat-containing protein [Kordiimonas marina]
MADRKQQLMDCYREITSQQLEYADNIPDLMKYENFDVEYLVDRDAHFQELDAMPPLDRANKGADEWNYWVQWAQLNDERWMVLGTFSGYRSISLRQAPRRQGNVDYFLLHGIDFAQGQVRDTQGRYLVAVESFDEFIFPCITSFERATFAKQVSFDLAVFANTVYFFDACFHREVEFSGAHFLAGEAVFDEASFKGYVSFVGAQFAGVTSFMCAEFSDSIGLEGVYFGAQVNFHEALFREFTWFADAKFLNDVSFERAIFCGPANWCNCQFERFSNWRSACFLDEAYFSFSQFGAAVDFDHTLFGRPKRFQDFTLYKGLRDDLKRAYDSAPVEGNASKSVPNFKGTIFRIPPNLGFTQVAEPVAEQGRWWQWGKTLKAIFAKTSRTQDADAGAKLRRLQELAAAGHHHLAEKRFFRAELLCRRGHEATSWQEIAMINLFELFSKCGLSFWRPIFWWANASVFFGILYWLRSSRFGIGGLWTDMGHLVNYTLANAFPIVGVFHASNSRAVDALFGEANGVPFDVGLMAGAHNIASTIFLFFALLAVRNYFKLG